MLNKDLHLEMMNFGVGFCSSGLVWFARWCQEFGCREAKSREHPPGRKQDCLQLCEWYTPRRGNVFQDYFILWRITVFRRAFFTM